MKIEFTKQECKFCLNDNDNYVIGRLTKTIYPHSKELLEEKERQEIDHGKGWESEIIPDENVYDIIACSSCGKISTYIRLKKGFVSTTSTRPSDYPW